MDESLKGVKGWLMFFVVWLAMAGIGYIIIFFSAMDDLSLASNVINLIFAPFLAILAVASAITISMQKKLGKWLAVSLFGLGALHSFIGIIITHVPKGIDAADIPALLLGIVIGLVLQGFIISYFFISKRVKETLVN